MRIVTYSMGISLDGYIVGPDGTFDDWATPNPQLSDPTSRSCAASAST